MVWHLGSASIVNDAPNLGKSHISLRSVMQLLKRPSSLLNAGDRPAFENEKSASGLHLDFAEAPSPQPVGDLLGCGLVGGVKKDINGKWRRFGHAFLPPHPPKVHIFGQFIVKFAHAYKLAVGKSVVRRSKPAVAKHEAAGRGRQVFCRMGWRRRGEAGDSARVVDGRPI